MIGLIGAGKMGYALLYAIAEKGQFKQEEIIVAEKNNELLGQVKSNFAVQIASNSAEAVEKAEATILAVKPQDMRQLINEIKKDSPNKLIISIAAGLKISFFEKPMPKARIVRVMPNIGCMVEQMAGAFALGSKAKPEDKQLVESIFSAAGMLIEAKEPQLDAVTALSGSGPAFYAFFANQLANAAQAQGLGKEQALKLSIQTMLGTAKLLQTGQMTPEALIKSVASPGGTTEAGLKKLEQKAVTDALSAAIEAAAKRSKELSK